MATDAVRMSQWPSDHRYVIPVAPGEDIVTVTIDGRVGAGAARRAADQGRAGARHLHPALLLARAHEAGRHVPHVPRRGRGHARPADLVRHAGRRRHGRAHAEPDGEERAGRRARVPAHQPPARLPGVRPRRRVPAAGPDARVRSRRVALRRGEAALREADPDQRPRPPRPRALHPVRPLHAVRRRDRGRPADRLRRPRRRHRGHHVSRTSRSRRTSRATPCRSARSARSPRAPYRFRARPWDLESVETSCTTCSVQLPRRAAVDVEPARAPARRRQRAGEPGLAVRQGPVRLRVGALRPSACRAPMVREDGELVEARGRRRSTPPPTRLQRRARGRRSRVDRACSAARAAPTRTRTRGPRFAKGVLGTDNVDAQLGDGLPAEVVLGLPRGDDRRPRPRRRDRPARPRPQGGAPGPLPAAAPGGVRARACRSIELARARQRPHAVRGDRRPRCLASRRTAARRRRSATAGAVADLAAAAARRRDGRRRARPRRRSRSPDAAIVQAAALLAACPNVDVPLGAAPRQRARRARPRPRAGLPARPVTLDAGRDVVRRRTGARCPTSVGLDAAGILAAAAGGKINALVLLGCRSAGRLPRPRARRAGARRRGVRDRRRRVPHRRRRADADVFLPVTRVGREGGHHHRTSRAGCSASAARSRPTARRWTDWRIAAELALRLGADFDLETVDEVQDEIARRRAGVRRRRRRAAAPRARRRGAAARRAPRRARARPGRRSGSPARRGSRSCPGSDVASREAAERAARWPTARPLTGCTPVATAAGAPAAASCVPVDGGPAARRLVARAASPPRDGTHALRRSRIAVRSTRVRARPSRCCSSTRSDRDRIGVADGDRGAGHVGRAVTLDCRCVPTRADPAAAPRSSRSTAPVTGAATSSTPTRRSPICAWRRCRDPILAADPLFANGVDPEVVLIVIGRRSSSSCSCSSA